MQSLQIETINSCNARCHFCMIPKQSVKRSVMRSSLFKSIIDQCKDYPVDSIMPFLNGEPLLDPDMVGKLEYINETLPTTSVILYSNGNLLKGKLADSLGKIKNLGFNFSINHVSEEGRMRIMGLSLSEAKENILSFHKKYPNVAIGVSAVMSSTFMTAAQHTEFTQEWNTNHKIKPNLFFEGNWAGKSRETCNSTGSCGRPETAMTVLSTGQVALCCYDIDGECNFGDLNKQSIKEIWEGEALEEYRLLNSLGRRAELKLCGTCTTG